MNESNSACDEREPLGGSTSKDNPVDPSTSSIGMLQTDSSDLGPLSWIQRQITSGADPRDLINELMPGAMLPSFLDDFTIWKLIFELLTEPPPREKLINVNTITDVVDLLQKSKNIIVLTGAGVSVACGIPDFRSRDGVYARLSKDFPDLPDPQAMFDIKYFKSNPKPFFKFAKEIYPGQFVPSLSHRFISLLEKKQRLLRNYTQNIDTLEQVAGISKLVQCHGSFATASCTNCKLKVESNAVKEDIFNQVIPKCPQCPENPDKMAVMKPDIVFFGENLGNEFYETIEIDKEKVDLLIVIGSSLKVRPVALIPNLIDSTVPQILINREPLPHLKFDIELLGNCDAVICHLCHLLGKDWESIIKDYEMPIFNSADRENASAAIAREIDEADIMDDDDAGHVTMPTVDSNTKQSELDHLFHSTVNSEHSDLLQNIQHQPSTSTALISPHKSSTSNNTTLSPTVNTENCKKPVIVGVPFPGSSTSDKNLADGKENSSLENEVTSNQADNEDTVPAKEDLIARKCNKPDDIVTTTSSDKKVSHLMSVQSTAQNHKLSKSNIVKKNNDSSSCLEDVKKSIVSKAERPLTPTGSKRKRSSELYHGVSKEPRSSQDEDSSLENELCSSTHNVHINQTNEIDEFYLHIPPSRYIFHGAELSSNLFDSLSTNDEITNQTEVDLLESDHTQTL